MATASGPAKWSRRSDQSRHGYAKRRRPDGGVGGLYTALTRATRALSIVHAEPLPEPLREDAALAQAMEEAARPFDLARAPMLRAVLWRLSPEDHTAALTMHHDAHGQHAQLAPQPFRHAAERRIEVRLTHQHCHLGEEA